jgi:hypothetical protein
LYRYITVFAPAVLDRVRQAVQAKFAAASPTLKKIVNAGLAAGEREFYAGRCGEFVFLSRLFFILPSYSKAPLISG